MGLLFRSILIMRGNQKVFLLHGTFGRKTKQIIEVDSIRSLGVKHMQNLFHALELTIIRGACMDYVIIKSCSII